MDVVEADVTGGPVGHVRPVTVTPHQHVLTGAGHCRGREPQLLKWVILIGLKNTYGKIVNT